MAIKRLLTDIWYTLKNMRNVWRFQRVMSKEHMKLEKMVEKIGPIGSFLHHFEEVPMDEHEVAIKTIMLDEFKAYLPKIEEEGKTNLKDLETFNLYCKQYNID